MNEELTILSLSAISIAFFHTLLGPDHYLPFIAMAKARKWSVMKTALITLFCGIGHVASSLILGIVGISFGIIITKLEFVESLRGDFAAWCLITFGLIYAIYGFRKAFRKKPHRHWHTHSNGIKHYHTHTHAEAHVHIHDGKKKQNLTPWALFVIFILGPCEPLIPLLMYPAAKESLLWSLWIAIIFGFVTVITMQVLVLVSLAGTSFLSLNSMEKYSHSIAGITICASGLAIQFLGL